MIDHDRGTGRTTRQIEALPDGAAFVVHCAAERYIVREALRRLGRTDDGVTVLVAGQRAEERLKTGAWTAIDVDHAVTDLRIRAVAAACRVAAPVAAQRGA